jgi:hypothetical protein
VQRFLFGSENQHNSQILFWPHPCGLLCNETNLFNFPKDIRYIKYIFSTDLAVAHRISLKAPQDFGKAMLPSLGEDATIYK